MDKEADFVYVEPLSLPRYTLRNSQFMEDSRGIQISKAKPESGALAITAYDRTFKVILIG